MAVMWTAFALLMVAAGTEGGINSMIRMSANGPDRPDRAWYGIQAVAEMPSGRTYLSHDGVKTVDLWSKEGENQMWRIMLLKGDKYHIEAASTPNGGKTFLSHNGHAKVDLWHDPGPHQTWRIHKAPGHNDAYVIEADEGAGEMKFLSHDGVSDVDLWRGAGTKQFWRIPGFSLTKRKHLHKPISPGGCADPFVWRGQSQYHMVCTGGRLPHYVGRSLTKRFKPAGHVLPGSPLPAWSQDGHRWAPEAVQVGEDSYVFFSSPSYSESGNPHRLGWARARKTTGGNKAWHEYAGEQWFAGFGKSAGGEIDPSVYQEVDSSGRRRYYLLWKTDDNAVGQLTTRLWMQEITFSGERPELQGTATMLLESSGLWWVKSWTAGGSLIEGPELLKEGGYYYLFFASGRYCQPDYAEGVARSTSLWGPYEKHSDPVISTGLVGHVKYRGGAPKIIGPGHAGFIKKDGTWYMVWHGSPGYNCDRHAFVSALRWQGGWPHLA